MRSLGFVAAAVAVVAVTVFVAEAVELPSPRVRLGDTKDPHATTHFSLIPFIRRVTRDRLQWKDGACPPVRQCTRKEVYDLTEEEFARFSNAVIALKNSANRQGQDGVDQFTQYHHSYGAHARRSFLAWHRYLMYFFEQALRQFDPSVCVPYWNSARDAGFPNPALDTVRTSLKKGPFRRWDSEVPKAHHVERHPQWKFTPLGTQKDYDTLVNSKKTDMCAFQPAIEGLHNQVHVFVGGVGKSAGDMSWLEVAANDPLFYMHHAFIDKLFTDRLSNRMEWCVNTTALGADAHDKTRVKAQAVYQVSTKGLPKGVERIMSGTGGASVAESLRFDCITYEPTSRSKVRGPKHSAARELTEKDALPLDERFLTIIDGICDAECHARRLDAVRTFADMNGLPADDVEPKLQALTRMHHVQQSEQHSVA